MKSLYKSVFALAIFVSLGLTATSCGEAPKTEEESTTEQIQEETIEAPADTVTTHEEHPSDAEHPSDGDENHSEDEHPN